MIIVFNNFNVTAARYDLNIYNGAKISVAGFIIADEHLYDVAQDIYDAIKSHYFTNRKHLKKLFTIDEEMAKI